MDQDAHEHEEIHLPPPSIAPLIVAAGITFTAVGGMLSLPLFVVGVIGLIIGLVMWVFNRG